MPTLAARQVVNSKLLSNVLQISLERLVFSSDFLARDLLNPFFCNVSAPDHANYGLLVNVRNREEE